MTFLLQKYNAINRTQVRGSLRSFASGVASTSRLAAIFLLLAGFLGVGSATAQTKILRMGGGPVAVHMDDPMNRGTNLQVHHYLISPATTPTTAGTNPTAVTNGTPTLTSFLVGGLALVTINSTGDTMRVSPIAPGKFKIALSPDGAAALTTAAGSDNIGTPHEFEVMSANAPQLTAVTFNATYNQGVEDDTTRIALSVRDNVTAMKIKLQDMFSDPNDIFITFDAAVDMVAKATPSTYDSTDATTFPRRPKVDKSGVLIAKENIANDELTISLTEMAKENDATDIWVFARAGGEYARMRVNLTVGVPENPYIKKGAGIGDIELREDDDNRTIDLDAPFSDPTFFDEAGMRHGSLTGRDNLTTDAQYLEYDVTISDASASRVPAMGGTTWTWVSTSMTATVTITDATTTDVGHDEGASLVIDPRAPGTATFTVTATDKGVPCREGYIAARVDADQDPDQWVTATVGADSDPATHCYKGTTGTDVSTTDVTTALYSDAKSISDMFTVNIITKTTPKVSEAIAAVELDAEDPMSKTVDVEDVNGSKAGTPKAFTGTDLTYTVSVADAKTDPKEAVMASVEGSVITLTPVWRAGEATVEATVTATNAMDESNTSKFNVTVKSASTPVVNPAVEPFLADGIMIERGMSETVDLFNPTKGTTAATMFPVFIDPNYTVRKDDPLKGGLHLEMKVEDVVADHKYEGLSSLNDVYTSAGRVTLDPAAGTLTVVGTAPNDMTVTVHATDRERKTTMATTTITVTAVTSAEAEELPTEVGLSQNYPNPFNPQTTIEYALPLAGDVSLIVYDMLGREVATLLNGPQTAGRHAVRFDASHLSNGTYVYRLAAPNKTITRTMVLVK